MDKQQSASVWLFWMFRIAVAAEFIGHGAFGIITKPAWVPYFGVFGIAPGLAYRLMPVIGSIDISLGLITLFSPRRALLLYMACWGLMTSLLRPLSGESFYEAIERAGNYGVPLAFLLFAGWGRSLREWFGPIARPELRPQTAQRLAALLRLTTGLLLIGHGAFGALLHKPMLGQQYALLGLGPLETVTPLVGWFEILLGAGILARPLRPVLLFAGGWKIATELLYPLSGAPIWELVERGGSYCAALALYVLLTWRQHFVDAARQRQAVVALTPTAASFAAERDEPRRKVA